MTKDKGLDRLFVETKAAELFRDLTSRSTKNASNVEQPFKTLKDAYLWAVALGVKHHRKMPLSSRTDLVLWTYFSSEEKKMLETIAIAETGDLLVVENEGLVQEIAEEYANGGIRVIKELLIDAHGDPLWNLVDLID